MKLHLPLGLRSALLSCLAIVGGGFTACSGTVAVAGAVTIAIAASSQASGQWVPPTYTGNVSVTAAATAPLGVTENSVITYTYASATQQAAGAITATGFDIKLSANGDGNLLNFTGSAIAAKSVWFSQGRLAVGGADLTNAGDIYAQGGQMFLSGTLANHLYIGSSTYSGESIDSLKNVALRLENGSKVTGAIDLIEDAVVSTHNGTTVATFSGVFTTGAHKFTKLGAGTLVAEKIGGNAISKLEVKEGTFQYKTPNVLNDASVALGEVVMGGGVLSVWNGYGGKDVISVYQTINSLTLNGNATLETINHAGGWRIASLQGTNKTLTINFAASSNATQYVLIENGSFSGTLDLKQSNTGSTRTGIFGASNPEIFANAKINLSQKAGDPTSFLAFAVGGAVGNSMKVLGIDGVDGTYIVSYDLASDGPRRFAWGITDLLALNQARTLELTGSDSYTFNGTIGNNLTLEKTGTGSQMLRSLGNNVTVNLRQGSMKVLGTVGEGSVINTSAGTSLVVPWAMSGTGASRTAKFVRPTYVTGEGSLSSDVIYGIGNTSDGGASNEDYTVLDPTGYTESYVNVEGGLISVCNGTANADFGTITKFILNGGGLITNNSLTTNTYTVTEDIEFKGTGYLRAYGALGGASAKTILTGALTGNGKLIKTDAGEITIAGDLSKFTGEIIIGGGSLAFDQDYSLSSFVMRNDSRVKVINGHQLTITPSVFDTGAGRRDMVFENGSNISFNRMNSNPGNGANVTINLISTTNGSLTTNQFTGCNTGNTTVNVGANTAWNITGSNVNTEAGNNFVNNNTFLLSHWQGAGVYTIDGTLNMLNCPTFTAVDPSAQSQITVKSGGVLNLKGLNQLWRDTIKVGRELVLTLESGSMMNLGSAGINTLQGAKYGGINLVFNGGTLGILDSTISWTTASALTLNGDVTVDTRLYKAATDGKAGTYTNTSGTITLSGAITGTGTLIKKGAGTLVLNSVSKLNVQEGFVSVTGGNLTIDSLTAMTENGGRFLLNLGTDKVTAATYAGRVNLNVVFASGGTVNPAGYDVFQGAAGLVQGDVNILYFLDRGLTGSYSVTNGLVHVTLGGTVDTQKYNITWAGADGAIWANNDSSAWTGGGGRFSTGDNVTFDGGGIKDVSIVGKVNPGTITVSGTENYSFTGGNIIGAGALTKSGTGKLTINSDTSSWTGDLNLQGGTIAFRDSLGQTNHINVSGTSELEWLGGNASDLSARIVMAAGSNLTFNTGTGAVAFGTKINGTGDYVKTGTGSLTLNIAQGLTGNITINQGDLILASGGAAGGINGVVTVNNGGRLVLNALDSTGYNDTGNLTSLTINEGGALFINTTGNQTLTNMVITLQGGTISGINPTAKFDLGKDSAGTSAVTTLASAQTSVISTAVNIRQVGGVTFTVADGAADTDLLISNDLKSTNGSGSQIGETFTKAGAGTMQITGSYSAGAIVVNGGKLILGNGSLSAKNITLAAGTDLVIKGGTFKWSTNDAQRSIDHGTITLESDGTMWTNSNWKYHVTLGEDVTLKGSGKWITGIPTVANQTDGHRSLFINGKTAGFSGILEVQGTGGAANSTYRSQIVLNSADGVLGGVVRMQGVVQNNGWATNDDSVVPVDARLMLRKSMQIGGIEGKGGILETDDASGVGLTLGDSGNHTFSGSMKGVFKSLTKQGSGTQVLNGDLSASIAGVETITVSGGKLGLGSTNYAGNVTLSGAGASLAAGKVTVGAGKTLTVSGMTTVIDSNLDLAGGSVVLGTEVGDYSVGLNTHSLNLSSTNKTNLSLVLAENLVAGDLVTLFSGVSGVTNNGTALTFAEGTLLSDYFNIGGIFGLSGAKLQLSSDGKLQIVLARSTGSLIYGQGNNGVWTTSGAFEESGAVFTAGATVSFESLGTNESVAVQLKGDLTVGGVSVNAGTGNTYTFKQHTDGGKIVSLGDMEVNSGTAILESGVLAPTANTTISVGNAMLVLNTGSINEHVALSLANGSTLKWGTGNTADYSSLGGISAIASANITLDLNGNAVELGKAIANSATYSVKGGNLTLGNHDVLSGSVILSDSGNLILKEASSPGAAYSIAISGSGDVSISGANAVTLSGINSYSGATNLLANSRLNVTDTSLSAATSQISLATGSTFDYTATKNVSLDRKLTGTGNVIFQGAKEITLTGANDYTGTTTITAGTTLNVSNTSIGGAGNAIANSGTLSINTGAGAYTVTQAISGAGALKLQGSNLTWNATGKTYTGNTTIITGSTVSSAGALTSGVLGENDVRLVTVETGVKLVLTDAAATESWLDNAGSNAKGLFLRGDGTVRLQFSGDVTSDGFIAKALQNAGSLSRLELASGARLVLSTNQNDKLATVGTIAVESGANMTVGNSVVWTGNSLSIAGSGIAGQVQGTQKAAALSLDPGAVLSRSLSLAADSTLFVTGGGSYSTLRGVYVGNGRTLTKTGTGGLVLEGGTLASGADTTGKIAVTAGVLSFNLGSAGIAAGVPYIWQGAISLADGTKLNKHDGYTRIAGGLQVNGNVSIASNWAKGFDLGAVSGTGAITLERGADNQATSEQLILAADNGFTGTWNVTGLWTLNVDHANALAKASVALGNSSLQLGVASADLVGLTGGATSALSLKSSQTSSILGISGSATNTFSGSVANGVTVEMKGTGTQTLNGTLSDGSKFTATQGNLSIASAAQSGSHVFTANGGTLNMQGYTRGASATGKDSFVFKSGSFANLTLGAGMEIKAGDGISGNITLGGATVLNGGAMVFRMTDAESPAGSGYYDLANGYAIATGGSVTMGSEKTLLTFVPVDKQLYPGDDVNGKNYILISGVGSGIAVGDLGKFTLNMSTEGRTQYILGLKDGDLVLTVKGAASTLTWKGATGNLWNTEDANLAWTDKAGIDTRFFDDDFVLFGTLDGSTSETITVNSGGVKMGGMTVTGSTDYTFTGGPISSSPGNTNAGLTIGTADHTFTGTLTLNTANSYAGNTTVNSGTVVAGNKDAFSNTKMTVNGGRVSLNFVGTLGTSSVEMAGGVLDASALGVVNVDKVSFTGAGSTHTLTASTGSTLAVASSSNTISGAWIIGSATDSTKKGVVEVNVGTLALTHGQDVTVQSGEFQLNGTTGSYTGANIVLAAGNFRVSGGMTATIKGLMKSETATSGITIVEDGSTLAVSERTGVAGQINMLGGTLHGVAGLTLEKVYLYGGNTSLTGTVTLNNVEWKTGENDAATLSVGKAGTSGSVVLGSGVTSLNNVDVVNGTLTVKDADQVGLLTSSGTVTTLATSAALSAQTAVLKAGSSIANTVTLTLTGTDSWLGENATAAGAASVGKVVLDGTNATAHMGDKLVAQEITVKNGTLFLDKTTGTVQNGIELNGSLAKFDMMGNASSISITMNQGSLAQSAAYTGTITIDDLTTTGGKFDMGGLSSNALVNIDQLAAGSSLTNLQNIKLGDSTLTLVGGMNPIFVMTGTTGTVSMGTGATVTFVTNGAIQRVLANGSESFRLTNGSLSGLANGAGIKDGVVFDPTLGLYNISASINGGNLVFKSHGSVDPDSIYKSTKNGTLINSYDTMDDKSMVDIDADTTINLTDAEMTEAQKDEGLIIKNLHNTAEAKTTLTVNGTTDDLVTLNNNISSTWFNGNINVSNVVLSVNNTDATANPTEDSSDRELTIQGTLTSTGLINLENGRLVLNGNGNSLTGGLAFTENEQSKGTLAIKGNTSLAGGINGARGEKADILVDNATLTLMQGSVINAWISGTGMESIAIEGGASATFGEHARVDKLGLFVDENRTAVIETTEDGALTFNGLSGKGILKGASDASITLDTADKSSVFSGNLNDYAGSLIVKGTGAQTFNTSMNKTSTLSLDSGNVILKTSGSVNMTDADKLTEGHRSYGVVSSIGASSKLTIHTSALTDGGMSTNNKISMEKLSMENGTLAFTLNLTNDLKAIEGVLATVTNGTSISGTGIELNISSVASDFSFRPGEEMTLFLMSGVTDSDNITLRSNSILGKYYSSSSVDVSNGYLYVTGTTVTGDTAHFHADAAISEIGRAGADLLDYFYGSRNPQVSSPDSIETKVLNSVERIILGGNKAEADRVMSGVAGSTVTSLSAAFATSMTDRIDSLRNRMTGMGADQSVVNEDLPNFHAWISADGGYNDLSTDGRFSGYSLNTWGGTVGMDVDVSERFTIGAAFSASYGDLTANAAESARGDLDTYTVAAFARIQAKSWNHDFAVAGSSADATLCRTVNYGDGSYSTNGTTTGFGVAAMYEASYSIPVGEDKENLFQPLFRASFTHASMDSYSESDAGGMGLNVGKQSVNYATFGIGARYLANVGQNIYNRNSILELRALILQDAGSRGGEADVALSGAPERTRRVKGAEPGSTGIQVGAGLTIPVQTSSAIFADVSVNARSKMTTVNGSVGYRISF